MKKVKIMELPIDVIISSIATALCGGSIGGFFTWRWQRAKAKSEAKEKEAEAKSAEVDMAQKVQDTYQQMLEDKQKEVEDNHRLIAELREDRDHYKQGYIEFRDQVEKLNKEFRDFRHTTEEERASMKRDIARNGRQLECLLPMLCGREGCPDRVLVRLSDIGIDKPSRRKKDQAITPYGKDEGQYRKEEDHEK